MSDFDRIKRAEDALCQHGIRSWNGKITDAMIFFAEAENKLRKDEPADLCHSSDKRG